MTAHDAVNVLSVMSAAVELGSGNANFNMILARDAVAKLIEAAHATLTHDPVFDTHHEERLRAALARVGGAQV